MEKKSDELLLCNCAARNVLRLSADEFDSVRIILEVFCSVCHSQRVALIARLALVVCRRHFCRDYCLRSDWKGTSEWLEQSKVLDVGECTARWPFDTYRRQFYPCERNSSASTGSPFDSWLAMLNATFRPHLNYTRSVACERTDFHTQWTDSMPTIRSVTAKCAPPKRINAVRSTLFASSLAS